MLSSTDPHTARVSLGKLHRIDVCELEIIRENLLLDGSGEVIPMSQVMPRYIPKEPVKACVYSPTNASSRTSSMMLSEAESDTYAPLPQPIHKHTTDRPHQLTRATRPRLKKSRQRNRKRAEIATKQRPVNVVGPIVSHLYDTNEDKEDVFSASGAESLESEGDSVRLQEELIAQKKLISKLEADLTSQLKVNADLKKLLVASVGNDLEYRVEKLAQDKAQLSATVGSYSEKLYKDFEDLDRISIQADMWRSKYMASRVQAEELSRTKATLTRKYSEAMTALQQMLEERQGINDSLLTAHRLFLCVHRSSTANQMLPPSPSANQRTPQSTRSTQQLSDDMLALANGMAKGDNLLASGSQASTKATGTPSEYSLAESTAYTVLSGQLIPVSPLEVPHNDDIPRYTSLLCQTRPATTGRCGCKNCKSEVIVV